MAEPGWPFAETPFHEGELRVQERVGVKDKMDNLGRRVVRDYMPEQHTELFTKLPFVFLGAQDDKQRPWASMLVGDKGFVASPHNRRLRIHAMPHADEPVHGQLRDGQPVGFLGLEPINRRRNRMNGMLSETSGKGFNIDVVQSYGNCPQYIQARDLSGDISLNPNAGETESGRELGPAQKALILKSDTFFIATQYVKEKDNRQQGVDVSHRGGKPGFVSVYDDNVTLAWPDFAGNLHFNTLGNIELDPRAGILFVDFDTGDLLSMTGIAEVVWDGPEVEAFQGAERIVKFRSVEWVFIPKAYAFNWSNPEFSPLLALTGDWQSAQTAAEASKMRDRYRPFRLTRKVQESATITSFYLEPQDDFGVAPYTAGQFLPIQVEIGGRKISRTYTLSLSPDRKQYRLSIKREAEGQVSKFMHDEFHEGDILQAMAPRGDFVLSDSKKPVVLLSAGVGITPMIAMLQSVVYENARTRGKREAYFIHGTQDANQHALRDEIEAIAADSPHVNLAFCYSRCDVDNLPAGEHFYSGRLDADTLRAILPFGDYEFYLCGPGEFVKQSYQMLRAFNVPKDQIFYEFFGPSALVDEEDAPDTAPAEGDVLVKFAVSGKQAHWSPQSGTLLELAEEQGLEPMFGCRSGSCHTCAVKLHQGKVHTAAGAHPASEDQVLICCSQPDKSHLDELADQPLILEL